MNFSHNNFIIKYTNKEETEFDLFVEYHNVNGIEMLFPAERKYLGTYRTIFGTEESNIDYYMSDIVYKIFPIVKEVTDNRYGDISSLKNIPFYTLEIDGIFISAYITKEYIERTNKALGYDITEECPITTVDDIEFIQIDAYPFDDLIIVNGLIDYKNNFVELD